MENEKRKEQLRKAQNKFKNIQTKLKIEEFEEIEKMAKSENITISKFLKNSLEAIKSSKMSKGGKLPSETETLSFKASFEHLNSIKEELEEVKNKLEKKNEEIRLEKLKNLELNKDLNIKNLEISRNLKELEDLRNLSILDFLIKKVKQATKAN